jgi:hypothetical protein
MRRERDPAVSEAMIRWAAINTITRRIPAEVPPLDSRSAPSQPQGDLLKHALRQTGCATPPTLVTLRLRYFPLPQAGGATCVWAMPRDNRCFTPAPVPVAPTAA